MKEMEPILEEVSGEGRKGRRNGTLATSTLQSNLYGWLAEVSDFLAVSGFGTKPTLNQLLSDSESH